MTVFFLNHVLKYLTKDKIQKSSQKPLASHTIVSNDYVVKNPEEWLSDILLHANNEKARETLTLLDDFGVNYKIGIHKTAYYDGFNNESQRVMEINAYLFLDDDVGETIRKIAF